MRINLIYYRSNNEDRFHGRELDSAFGATTWDALRERPAARRQTQQGTDIVASPLATKLAVICRMKNWFIQVFRGKRDPEVSGATGTTDVSSVAATRGISLKA